MIVSNGVITRNIAEKQLPEYKAKGYKEVVAKSATTSKPLKLKRVIKNVCEFCLL